MDADFPSCSPALLSPFYFLREAAPRLVTACPSKAGWTREINAGNGLRDRSLHCDFCRNGGVLFGDFDFDEEDVFTANYHHVPRFLSLEYQCV